MPRPNRVATRPLWDDVAAAVALAVAAGPHGVYVQNALAVEEGEGFLLSMAGIDQGVCWFGPRGNLVVVASPELPADEVAEAVQCARIPWRIAMGPAAIVDALRERCVGTPLLHRDQVYYGGTAATAARDLVRADVRTAQRSDRDRLVLATLQLNASDLNIDPARVDRRWLRDTIDERIAGGTTHVLGPVGSIDCKLDLGSDGPGGQVLEGVFTFPAARGQGLAASLVATCLSVAPGPVCLHVGVHNAPARAAYERAGMTAVGRCRLLLLG